jgi:hypothetical protein
MTPPNLEGPSWVAIFLQLYFRSRRWPARDASGATSRTPARPVENYAELIESGELERRRCARLPSDSEPLVLDKRKVIILVD